MRTAAQKLAQREYKKQYNATDIGIMGHHIGKWKGRGLIWDTWEEIEGIYTLYLGSTTCETCNKQYKNNYDRCMDHDHSNGKFRNILCRSCNTKIKNNNTSGITNIRWDSINKIWVYRIMIDSILYTKSKTNKEWLINHKLEYEKENLYIY
jgi:hypothetical protein